jgi:penicillin amidase
MNFMKRAPGVLFPLIALMILIAALSIQMFSIPPLGKLLDPFSGMVQNGQEALDQNQSIAGNIGIGDSVRIYFDDRKVPHIYAVNTEDLYYAQGYVTASLRLWQMDFLSYVSAGRLAEIFKDASYFDYDRRQRRMGFFQAARETLVLMQNNPETNKVLCAYTRGVNAYINTLDYEHMPLEYKLLDYKPEPWTNLKSVLLIKYMAGMLSGYEEDLTMSKAIMVLGEEKFNRLFTDYPKHDTPLVNDSSAATARMPPLLHKPDYLDYAFLSSGTVIPPSLYNPRLGSNSWVVSGKKTTSGFPILCNDPHLGLYLPATWLEMQLAAPGINVYGVSIPGTPSVIIGFNENIAWGLTNGVDDVMDWYKLKITDDFKKYEFGGEWKDMQISVEEIKRKDQQSFFDTIYRTVHGPIVYDKRFTDNHPDQLNFALRWEMHQPSNEFLTFIGLNRARNYDEFRKAISHYACPVQNFTFACRNNDIAICHQGSMPVKWPGQGKFILDGTKRAHLYTAYIPGDSLPHTRNPSCNYVFSANQRPTGNDYPYYYNGYFFETRADRIHSMLDKENHFDIAKMQSMQLDNTNSFAAEAVPVLLAKVDSHFLNTAQQQQLRSLSNWKGTYDFNDVNARLFEIWWKNVTAYTWDELKSYSFFSRLPDNYILLDLIKSQPFDSYFDHLATPGKENARDIITKAFCDALKEYEKEKKKSGTHWSDFNKVSLMHPTYIPAFSQTGIPMAGHPDAINAVSAGWGPSWRMIVELGNRPKAYGIYPGGQSGRVGSNYYNGFVRDWSKGQYYPLQFYMSVQEARDSATNCWVLKK